MTIKGKGEDGALNIEVPVPGKDCTVALSAENRFVSSDPAVVKLTWGDKTRVLEEAFSIKPKLDVLPIGVSNDDDPNLKLGLADNDVRDFAAVLQRQGGQLYRAVEERVQVFASSTGNQYSLEDPKWGNGAFTKALIEGRADYRLSGRITINVLDLGISEQVKEPTGGQ